MASIALKAELKNMSKSLNFIYDDRFVAEGAVANIVGTRPYGSIVFKRKTLFEHIQACLKKVNATIKFYHILSDNDFDSAMEEVLHSNAPLYYFPSYVVPNIEEFPFFLNKYLLAKFDSVFREDRLLGIYLNDPHALIPMLRSDVENEASCSISAANMREMLIDIYEYQNCLPFFSGGFETRYFNKVCGDENYITKSSTNTKKIHSEYSYYYLLPQKMQHWFVQPFDYKENGSSASYVMERFIVPDVALQWIHHALSLSDYGRFLDKILQFLDDRHSKQVEKTVFCQKEQGLYFDKLFQRLDLLKKTEPYLRLNSIIGSTTSYHSIDHIFEEYKKLYMARRARRRMDVAVIGHGDLCFSNILYEKNTGLLRLLDPKGAQKEEDLWTDAYYDIAKLSHSALGDYDWINNDLFSLKICSGNRLELNIDADGVDLPSYKQIFLSKMENAGYDMYLVRLYESSLFLSMLPLHIDHEQKVLAFIVRAINILEELKSNV